ncbi:competence protein ComEC [Sphingopyxis sp. H038]|uniref:ComEC/Rec2 family competence protein n=1 Tax=unclassified Sphingopyxis TaxID=2614943 RepID=UPI0007317ADC|nr:MULTISPECIES: ComEC/Rec2 family competence protein [unclassified Sphingopyxis]KTE02169.1 competence protein ComEC [Sphingopyxis sp. H012]KTE09918.1 competence protein ComEC [Sphingopyxis sp. H053]KTE15315.1 competence protein ComEC [Sphingopyxis sp. H093]KTE26200.1 competence protein ComEC [Sphingopyxis sp. H080]KTE33639.1 competence protein ComEC [Sphingopyxis sp. H038]
MATRQLQTPIAARWTSIRRGAGNALETRLEAERERIGLWLPVALGAGIAAWFALPAKAHWIGLLLLLAGGLCGGLLIGWQGRLGRVVVVGCSVMAAGVLLIWTRAVWVAAPVLAGPVVTEFSAIVERAEPLPAKGQIRILALPQNRSDLPPRVRLTLRSEQAATLTDGETIGVRARLMPPPTASLPGGYDFAQRAWFDRIGAVGTVLGEVSRVPAKGAVTPPLRARLSAHIHDQIDGSPGGIAAALVTGDRGAISEADEEAMRRSGLAHLLSISGLHVTAVVGFAMLLTMRLLALSRRLALAGYVLPLAAAAGALAGGDYTLLAGAEVPTLRSFIAALLVLIAFLMGREALTLRLVAAGALIVLIWRPESLAGPSFQLSFAAVTAIIALHESRPMHAFLARRDEAMVIRLGRGVAGLLLTGLVVEVALAPIALFHFHKAGLYGALANVVAIPLTTFVIMPAEALALLFDSVGLGAPFWWITEQALLALIGLAHGVADAPGAVAMMPSFPRWGFALAVFGGLWLLLWKTGWRRIGAVPLAIGMAALLVQPRPDLLVTGDGRHIAAAMPGGSYALLRDKAGDYVRDSMAEAAGVDAPLAALTELDHVECNRDFCRWNQGEGAARRIILASRGRDRIEGAEMAAACAAADVVISDRWLPHECAGRWMTIDRDSLATSGGLALYLGEKPEAVATLKAGDGHPWRLPQQLSGNDEAIPTGALAR